MVVVMMIPANAPRITTSSIIFMVLIWFTGTDLITILSRLL